MSAALRAQQLAFDAAVREGASAAALLAPRVSGEPVLLGIYAHGYVARLANALRDNHEVLARALGDAAFDALAEAYVRAHPSSFSSIRWFGGALAHFMDAHDELVPHPAFADLARMDWALRDAFDAADAQALQRESLARLPAHEWPAMRFAAHPSVRLVPLQWSVEAAWRALRDAPEGEEPALAEPQALRHDLLVWRQGLETRWRSLSDHEAPLLRAALDGEPFAMLCERAPDASVVAGLLGQWISQGLFRS